MRKQKKQERKEMRKLKMKRDERGGEKRVKGEGERGKKRRGEVSWATPKCTLKSKKQHLSTASRLLYFLPQAVMLYTVYSISGNTAAA